MVLHHNTRNALRCRSSHWRADRLPTSLHHLLRPWLHSAPLNPHVHNHGSPSTSPTLSLCSRVQMQTSAIVSARIWFANVLGCAVVVVAAPPRRGHRSLLLPMLQSCCSAVDLHSCALASDAWCRAALHSGKPVGHPHCRCRPPCIVHVRVLVHMTRRLRHAHASTVCPCRRLALLLCPRART